MRITLRWKITAILVLVGLVPAAIVGWFAYYANDDYKNKQKLLVQKTAESISFRAASVMLASPTKVAESAVAGTSPLPDAERSIIQEQIRQELGNALLNSAQVYVVNSDGKVVVWRRANQGFETNARERDDRCSLHGRGEGGSRQHKCRFQDRRTRRRHEWQARAGQLRPATPGGPA